jgi:hypothetical protein
MEQLALGPLNEGELLRENPTHNEGEWSPNEGESDP